VQESGSKGSFAYIGGWASSPLGGQHGGSHTLSPLDDASRFDNSPPTWQRMKDTSGTEYPLISASFFFNPNPIHAWSIGDRGVAYDPVRNYVYGTNGSSGSFTLWGTKLQNPIVSTALTSTFAAASVTEGTFLYLPEYDLLFWHRFTFSNGQNVMNILDPTANYAKSLPAQLGTPPDPVTCPIPNFGGGGDWCPDYPGGPAFVYYGGGPNDTDYPTTSVPFPFHDLNVWVAQPMAADGVTWADPKVSWFWRKVPMTPVVSPDDLPHAQCWKASIVPSSAANFVASDGAGHVRRFVYCRPLKAFLWFPDTRSPFSIFKVF
jgi:hypothetical protein